MMSRRRVTRCGLLIGSVACTGVAALGRKASAAVCRAVGSEWVKLNWDLFHMQRYEGDLIHNMRKGKERARPGNPGDLPAGVRVGCQLLQRNDYWTKPAKPPISPWQPGMVLAAICLQGLRGPTAEHEHPIRVDMRDLKVWLMVKLLEDPYRDYDALVRDFTDGFYDPAGATIRRYLADLQATAEATGSNVNWFPSLSQYTYLTLGFPHKRVPEAESECGITNRAFNRRRPAPFSR